ncbi:AraC family transcriptional regulator [Bradyrhizobium sp. BRP56]|uniref:AraC family transcriptional regulator n=1 Tax=Bradyrhizobium sp. BRP56 TaxID=2793819 RepID=UPI001CD3A95E|nr:AraC family transcriptional regulator [Bradyrhizobium sp. BRP56]MCA1399500.1 AraC family transcriptional regulator ligand-binding domain-containing protein [Bradyrhizobium sp. BRP56]
MAVREQSVICDAAADATLAAVASKAYDVRLLKAKLGIEQGNRTPSKTASFPLATFTAALEAAASDRGDGLLGLKLGKSFQFEGFGELATLALVAATLGDALEKFVRHSSVLQSNSSFDVSVSGDLARLSYAIVDPAVKLRRQDACFTVAVQHAFLSRKLGYEVRPSLVEFQHTPEPDASDYRAHFGCTVQFGKPVNSICFPARLLEEPAVHANPDLGSQLEAMLADRMQSMAGSFDFSFAIDAWMVSAFSAGTSVEIEQAASDFGMSLRSFQRKLMECEINYLEIRNRVRCRIARQLLSETSTAITSIALYLGYSETSAFSRVFRHLTNISPSRYRMQARPAHDDCDSWRRSPTLDGNAWLIAGREPAPSSRDSNRRSADGARERAVVISAERWSCRDGCWPRRA